MDRGAWRATVHGVTESDTTEQISTVYRGAASVIAHPSTPLSCDSLEGENLCIHSLYFTAWYVVDVLHKRSKEQ